MQSFIIQKIEEIAFAKVTPEEPLWSSRTLDSITLVELIVELEAEYNVKVPFNEIVLEHFETVARMVKYLESKR